MTTTTTFYRGFIDPQGAPRVYVGRIDAMTGQMAMREMRALGIVGLTWGNDGMGGRSLALALLTDVLNDDRKAIALAPVLCSQVIARLSADQPWMISDNIVRALAGMIAKEPVAA